MIDLGILFEKSLSKVFGQIKLNKKGSRNICIYLLKKLSRLRRKFYSTALVLDTFYVKYCSVLTQYYKIEITFLSKR